MFQIPKTAMERVPRKLPVRHHIIKAPPSPALSPALSEKAPAEVEDIEHSEPLSLKDEPSSEDATGLSSDQESRTLLDPDDDPFSTETSKILFDAIDELRKIEAGQDLDLPQLVIVGKQSAGKSSLLQSLTDIPFPIGDGLCTQFATRIISRRTEPGEPVIIKASIEAGDINPFPYEENRVAAADFTKDYSILTEQSFKKLIEDAKEVMGLSAEGGTPGKTFSSLVLKLELSGPDRSHFGILDIPGIYSNRRAGTNQARKEMEGVEKMVVSYMKKRENIVICVADALDDVQNQKVFDLAQTHVDSSRVVGVWTKCDITPKVGMVVRHVRDGTGIPGRSTRWFVVRNRGSDDPESLDREQEEKAIFSKGAWLDVPEEQRGTPMLKKFLAHLLSRRIRDSFPVMQDTVARVLAQERARELTFGTPRIDHSQRRGFLFGIANRFQDLAKQSLSSPGDLPSDDLKLRGMTATRNLDFARDLSANGLLFPFVEIGDDIEIGWDNREPVSNPEPTRRGDPFTPVASPDRNAPKPGLPRKRLAPLYQEIRNQMETNRGIELPGMLNPAVMTHLWKKQTCKWESFGEKHIESIVSTTKEVSLKMLDLATKDVGITERARIKLESVIVRFSEAERIEAKKQLRTLCNRNSSEALQTTDPKFTAMVRACRSKRFLQAMTRFHQDHPPLGFLSQLPRGKDAKPLTDPELAKIYNNWVMVSAEQLTALFNEIHPQGERSQNIEDEIHDLLRSYYEIEIQNFIHHILHHIVEPFLNSPKGPLLGFSATWVNNLTVEDIEDLGGEDESIVANREACISKIVRLEAASRIAEEALRKTRSVEAF